MIRRAGNSTLSSRGATAWLSSRGATATRDLVGGTRSRPTSDAGKIPRRLRLLGMTTHRWETSILALSIAASSAQGQSPLRHWTEAIDSRFAMSQPVIGYGLQVAPADTSGFAVNIDIHGRRDTVLLAMAAHPEYDDRYWRFVRDVRVEGAGGRASVSKVDSAVWRVIAPGGSFTLHYRLVLPPRDPRFRSAWQP